MRGLRWIPSIQFFSTLERGGGKSARRSFSERRPVGHLITDLCEGKGKVFARAKVGAQHWFAAGEKGKKGPAFYLRKGRREKEGRFLRSWRIEGPSIIYPTKEGKEKGRSLNPR